MVIPTRSGWDQTDAVNSLFVATLPHRQKEIIDAWFKDDAFLDDLYRKKVTKSGGTHFSVPIRMDESPNAAWIAKGGTLGLSDQDTLRTSIWDWRCLADAVVAYRWDDLENAGKEAQVNWVEDKIKTSKKTLRKKLLVGLFGDREPAAGASVSPDDNEPNSIQYLLNCSTNGYNAGGAWGTASPLIGGISGNLHEWWRHHVDAHATTFAAGGMAALEALRMKCMRFGDEPDWLLMGETAFGLFIEEWRTTLGTAVPVYRTAVSEKPLGGDLGVEGARFHGMRPYQSYFYPDVDGVTASEHRMDMVNTDYLQLITRQGKGVYFEGPHYIPNQVGDRVYKLAYDIQFILTNPQSCGTLMDIT